MLIFGIEQEIKRLQSYDYEQQRALKTLQKISQEEEWNSISEAQKLLISEIAIQKANSDEERLMEEVYSLKSLLEEVYESLTDIIGGGLIKKKGLDEAFKIQRFIREGLR